MKLHIINSNSSGNSYLLEAQNGEVLMLECGVAFDKIKKALNFNLRRVSACLVTHEHGDHSKAIGDVMAAGINVYSSEGTFRALGVHKSHRAIYTFANDFFNVGNFKVRSFDVKHDCAEPLGFLIHHNECGNVLFLTDSYYCEYNFTGLNNILIEANYCQKILDRRVEEGANPMFLRDRVITSHMSLETCKKTLQAYDLSNVNNIILIHLSDANSDEKKFQSEVESVTGKPVRIATPGLIIDLNKKQF